MILKPYSAVLTRHIEADDTSLPLSESDANKLRASVPAGERTLLVLRDDTRAEEIEVTNIAGFLTITRRGAGETEAHKFPRGTSLCFEVTVSVVEWLIEHRMEGPCDGVRLVSVPELVAKVGVPWRGEFCFEGAQPITFMAVSTAAWLDVDFAGDVFSFFGTPDAPGVVNITFKAHNCEGRHHFQDTLQILVSAS
jgi:hypothetical protein